MILFKSFMIVAIMWELIYFSYRFEKGDFFDF